MEAAKAQNWAVEPQKKTIIFDEECKLTTSQLMQDHFKYSLWLSLYFSGAIKSFHNAFLVYMSINMQNKNEARQNHSFRKGKELF
jgi:hypothetical protein